MPRKPERVDGLYARLYDVLRAHAHRPGLTLVPGAECGHRRAWLTAAGFGALGEDVEQAARLYVHAGGSLAGDAGLRDALRRLDERLPA
jgi:hypothetical protein